VALLGRQGQTVIPGVPAALQQLHGPARFAALKAATEAHKALSLEAIMGQGVDRHLFTLAAFASRSGSPTPALFADPSWAHFQDIRLSTSTLASPALSGGGFGPVNPTSYAVGYGTEDVGVHFHVMRTKGGTQVLGHHNSAAWGYSDTDLEAFAAALEGAVGDVATTLQGKER
jgi:hypothetical protein